jgi:hypothetical protein
MLTHSWQRTHLNFVRRYKWAFRPEYNDTKSAPVASPEYFKFVSACSEKLNVNAFRSLHFVFLSNYQNKLYSPTKSCRVANRIISGLMKTRGGLAVNWEQDRALVRPFPSSLVLTENQIF